MLGLRFVHMLSHRKCGAERARGKNREWKIQARAAFIPIFSVCALNFYWKEYIIRCWFSVFACLCLFKSHFSFISHHVFFWSAKLYNIPEKNPFKFECTMRVWKKRRIHTHWRALEKKLFAKNIKMHVSFTLRSYINTNGTFSRTFGW